MHLWGHRFSQNANQKLQGFLPYQTNKDRSTFFLVIFWWLYAVFLATILVCLLGQKSLKCLVGILGETMTSKIHSEFNWPLKSIYRSKNAPRNIFFGFIDVIFIKYSISKITFWDLKIFNYIRIMKKCQHLVWACFNNVKLTWVILYPNALQCM